MAIILNTFFVPYIYLATTGHIVFADFVTMVSGYAEKEEQ